MASVFEIEIEFRFRVAFALSAAKGLETSSVN